ncbi:uncharacterized protein LOC144702231 isoform X3 [Wolffia australiana]
MRATCNHHTVVQLRSTAFKREQEFWAGTEDGVFLDMGVRSTQNTILSLDITSKEEFVARSEPGANPKGLENERQPNFVMRVENVPEQSDSPEKRYNASCKHSLRKSLAWDSAFFSEEGVLDPEELASVNISFQKVRSTLLPVIPEDCRRSAESNGTLDSDIWADENLENHLFGNIRASIQRYQLNRSKDLATPVSASERKKLDVAGLWTASTEHRMKPTVTSKQSSTRRLATPPSIRPPMKSPIRLTSSTGNLPTRKKTGNPRTDNVGSSLPVHPIKGARTTKTLNKKQPSHEPTKQTHRSENTTGNLTNLSSARSCGCSTYSSKAVKPSGIRLPSPKIGYFDPPSSNKT